MRKRRSKFFQSGIPNFEFGQTCQADFLAGKTMVNEIYLVVW